MEKLKQKKNVDVGSTQQQQKMKKKKHREEASSYCICNIFARLSMIIFVKWFGSLVQ